VRKQPIILTDEIVPPPALVRAGLDALPAVIRARGERASRRFIEFFTANIRNRNTRAAYARAVKQFFDWTDKRRLDLHEIEAITVAAYIEQLGTTVSKPTVKQHLAAIRRLFDYLTTGGILDVNPESAVRGPKYVVRCGKTPVLSAEEARKLLDSFESDTLFNRPSGSGLDWNHGLQLRPSRGGGRHARRLKCTSHGRAVEGEGGYRVTGRWRLSEPTSSGRSVK
jgi:site-specific recombinase XerC